MLTLRDIVESGLCIGCGLCAAIGEDVTMMMTDDGVERPYEVSLSDHQLALVNRVCPGLVISAGEQPTADNIWGPYLRIDKGHAADPTVRHEAATGGVLTALAQFMLTSGTAAFVLHVQPSQESPLKWIPTESRSSREALAASGSRYGPVAPLTGFLEALDRNEPFAVVAKPCDAAAIRNLARFDERIDSLVAAVLVMACGGASKLTKTWRLLDDWSVGQSDVRSIRYRGFGNPGPTTVTTRSGTEHETSYLSLWEDQGTWDLQWRCKVCPDGMGEVADLVALDCWPGGSPTGEDAGFNGIIARTETGRRLLEEAIAAGVITIVESDLPVDILQDWQPHQSRRKRAIKARLSAMSASGLPALVATGFHLDEADADLTDEQRQAEFAGAIDRIRSGSNRDDVPIRRNDLKP